METSEDERGCKCEAVPTGHMRPLSVRKEFVQHSACFSSGDVATACEHPKP